MTELAVLVPVLDRPANVAPLVESFLAGCPEDSILMFLFEPNDVAEHEAILAIHHPRVWDIICGDGIHTWPEKINGGVKTLPPEGEFEWFLCAADDVRFTPGWWEATEALRHAPNIGVIGTHDSSTGRGNPRVAAGEHTCHPLISGHYIREHGTVDERGKAVHDGYSHWYVDDELVTTAKVRGAWAFCPEAVIEHLHPYWGYGEWDDTYAKGEANAEADGILWGVRLGLVREEAKKYGRGW